MCRGWRIKCVRTTANRALRYGTGRWVPWFAAVLLLSSLRAAEPPKSDRHNFAQAARAFLESHCFSCHGDAKAESELNLRTLIDDADFAVHYDRWEEVVTRRQHGQTGYRLNKDNTTIN